MDTNTQQLPQPIHFAVANLDAQTPAERASYMTILFSSAIDRDLRTLLLTYCAFKTVAENERVGGKIASAMSLEHICDNIYSQLPAWAKW